MVKGGGPGERWNTEVQMRHRGVLLGHEKANAITIASSLSLV